jgi:hypothetical protein
MLTLYVNSWNVTLCTSAVEINANFTQNMDVYTVKKYGSEPGLNKNKSVRGK